jgi:hypothetical protein
MFYHSLQNMQGRLTNSDTSIGRRFMRAMMFQKKPTGCDLAATGGLSIGKSTIRAPAAQTLCHRCSAEKRPRTATPRCPLSGMVCDRCLGGTEKAIECGSRYPAFFVLPASSNHRDQPFKKPLNCVR